MAFSGIRAFASASASFWRATQVVFQRRHAIVRGSTVLLGRGDDAGDFGINRASRLVDLAAAAFGVRMIGPEPAGLRLILRGELLQIGAQRHDRGRDRRLRRRAGPSARRIQSRIGGGQFSAGA